MICPTPVARAVLREPALPAALSILSEDGTWSSVPLVNQPLLERHLQELARAGITDVVYLRRDASRSATGLQALGQRWGLRVREETVEATPDTADDRVVMARHANGPALLLRMDCWPGINGLRAILLGSCAPARRLAGPSGPLPCFVSAVDADLAACTVHCRDALLMGTLNDYVLACQELLGRLGATSHLERGFEGDRFIGAGTRLHETVTVSGPCYIGAGVRVGKRSVIGPGAIVGDRVYLEADVRVSDSVVLGRCHLDAGNDLHGVIVTAEGVYCRHSGRPVEFDHTVVLPDRWTRRATRASRLVAA